MPWDNEAYYPDPKAARQATYRWAPTVAMWVGGFIAVVAVINLFGWWLGGWYQTHTTQRNFSNTVNSQQYQTSLVSEMEQHLNNISGVGGLAATRSSLPASSGEQATIRAQELSELREFCAESFTYKPGLSDSPDAQQLAADIAQNCSAGAAVADPPLAGPVPIGSN